MKKLAFAFLASFQLSYAGSDWYDKKLEGWYYFENPASSEEKKESIPPEKAHEILQGEKRRLAHLLSLALLLPTQENVEHYMREQKKWMDQSNRFASEWGKAILKDPLLGDFFKNPTTSYGVLAKKEIDLQQRKLLIKDLSKEHFLLFVFQGGDLFSKQASEVVKLFSEINEWKVKALSLDGKGLKDFSDFAVDKGMSQAIGVKASPSFFVVNPFSNEVTPIGAGLLSVSDLEENIEIQFGGRMP